MVLDTPMLANNLNFTPEQVMKAQRESSGITLSLTSTLDEVGGKSHVPAAFSPGKRF
jgi:hypothetical protein